MIQDPTSQQAAEEKSHSQYPTDAPHTHHVSIHDQSEGSEFLDESLRMDEQTEGHTEESVAAGSPKQLL